MSKILSSILYALDSDIFRCLSSITFHILGLAHAQRVLRWTYHRYLRGSCAGCARLTPCAHVHGWYGTARYVGTAYDICYFGIL